MIPPRAPEADCAIGWREIISLPGLGVDSIKIKADTGARTSALHVSELKFFRRGVKRFARFAIHPTQRSQEPALHASARVVSKKSVRSSTGHVTVRPVIHARVALGALEWDIELTLVNRDMMGFRMLLGREALRGRFLVDPARSYVLSERRTTRYRSMLKNK